MAGTQKAGAARASKRAATKLSPVSFGLDVLSG